MPCGVALSKRGYNMKRNIKEKAIHYSKIIAIEKKLHFVYNTHIGTDTFR